MRPIAAGGAKPRCGASIRRKRQGRRRADRRVPARRAALQPPSEPRTGSANPLRSGRRATTPPNASVHTEPSRRKHGPTWVSSTTLLATSPPIVSSRQAPSPPASSTVRRSCHGTPLPAIRSATVPVHQISPGSATAATASATSTARPSIPSGHTATSPAWRPSRETAAEAASSPLNARAQPTAAEGKSKR
jgi:hypothetical protein